jgi:hypothetical protein
MRGGGGVYEGERKDGKMHGKGKMTWPNGEVYEGEYKDDKMNGQGKLKYPNGTTTYEGEFKDDEFSGYGEYTNFTPSENYHFKYRGYYDNGVRHGFGYIFTSGRAGSGMMYGEFKNDKLISGTGRRIEGDGTIQEGDFINGNNSNGNIRNGKKIWPNNAYIYEGEFDKDGNIHGEGTMIYDTGWKYEGGYKHGLMNGYGVMHNPNGDVYEGEFENDKPHGKGKQKYADGTVYEGRFVNGQPHGPNAIASSRRHIWEELGMKQDPRVKPHSS